jgi:hypothetical protein
MDLVLSSFIWKVIKLRKRENLIVNVIANISFEYNETKSHIYFISLKSFIQGIHPDPRLLANVRNKFILYGEGLLASSPTPKLEDHPFSAVRNCLFKIFAATLHTWRASPPSAI